MKKINIFLKNKLKIINKNIIDTKYLERIIDYIKPIKCKFNNNIVMSYKINNIVLIKILKNNDNYLYCLDEPNIDVYNINKILETELFDIYNNYNTDFEKNIEIKYYIEKIKSRLGPIYALFHDEKIEEIALNSPNEPVTVYMAQPLSMWVPTNIVLSQQTVNKLLRNLAQMAKKPLSISAPIAEGIIPGGHRVALTWGQEVSRKGSSFVIRLKRRDPISLPQLINNKTISSLMAAYLWLTLEMRGPGLIIGGMASGKSVAGNEKITIIAENSVFNLSFEKLWKIIEQPSKKTLQIEYKQLKNRKIKFLTLYNENTLKVNNARFLIRHYYRGKLYKLETELGYTISVTPDHSLLVKTSKLDNIIKIVNPSIELVGAYLPVLQEDTIFKKTNSKNLLLDKITNIKEYEYDGYVYDLEIPYTQNFEASNIFVHNTTLLQSLLNSLPPWVRIVTIEDTPELQILHENWDALYTRISIDRSGESADIDLYELSKFALRRRADYIVIGEIRGKEAQVLAQAIATGHGSLSTFHAFDIRSALFRLTNEPISLNKDFLASLWNITVIRPESNGRRRVISVNEISTNNDEGSININTLFKWEPANNSFYPDTPSEVIKQSYRLRTVADELGLSEEDLINELALRQEFLESLAQRDVSTAEYRRYLREFYSEIGRRW